MRIWGMAIFALVAATAAHAADFPEAHLLLIDRHAVRLADTADDDAHFDAAAKPVYHALLTRHGANLILDARAAPAHWSGLDVTAEAVAAIKVPAQKNEAAAAPASSVRLLIAEISPADSSDAKFHETLERIAAGQGATLVVDRRAVVMSAPVFDVTGLVRSTLATYRDSGTLPVIIGGPEQPMAHIAVLNRGALMQNSAAGRDIAEQVRAITAKAKAELEAEAGALRREAVSLKQKIPSLAPKDAAKAKDDFLARQKAFAAKVQERQQTINAAVATAQKKIDTAAGPIVLKILNDGHANVMLDGTVVAASDDALDITPPATLKLNAALPHVDVVLDPGQKK